MLSFAGKKVLLMGLGGFAKGSGVTSAEFLASRGADLTITDLKSKRQLAKNLRALKKNKDIKYVLGQHRQSDFESADWIVRNPDVPPSSKYLAAARRRRIPIDNDITLFLREHGAKNVIGVTGTRGKSTTTALIYDMVRRQYPKAKLGGNIGESPLRFLMDSESRIRHEERKKNKSPAVLELSNFQLTDLDTIGMSPQVAIWTNLYPDHLNKYASIKEYIADKSKIFKYQKAGDAVVLNWDNKITKKVRRQKSEGKIKVFYFSLKNKMRNGAYLKDNWFIFSENGKETRVCPVAAMKLRGEHNQANILAAICAAKGYGIGWQAVRTTIRNFRGVPNRQEIIGETKGVTFVNDCTATSPQATIAALKSFPEKKIILISGGNSKGSPLQEMAGEMARCAKALILLPGNADEELLKEFKIQNSKSKTPRPKVGIFKVQNLQQAVRAAVKEASAGDFIVLSPGLTWLPRQNEFERGGEFRKLVDKIKKEVRD